MPHLNIDSEGQLVHNFNNCRQYFHNGRMVICTDQCHDDPPPNYNPTQLQSATSTELLNLQLPTTFPRHESHVDVSVSHGIPLSGCLRYDMMSNPLYQRKRLTLFSTVRIHATILKHPHFDQICKHLGFIFRPEREDQEYKWIWNDNFLQPSSLKPFLELHYEPVCDLHANRANLHSFIQYRCDLLEEVQPVSPLRIRSLKMSW